MDLSEKGEAFIGREENDVLHAYQDIRGVWTIGRGLTAASGVVEPHAGMIITREQSIELFREAFTRNYAPAVNGAMVPPDVQHAFDAGGSFHWNTGGIEKASWVGLWRKGDMPDARVHMLMWDIAGGKVLPALKHRREREFALLSVGDYGDLSGFAATSAAPAGPDLARIVVPMPAENIAGLRDGLTKLGYSAGLDPRGPTEAAVRAFQKDHGLAVDGIVGNATLHTVERALGAN